MKCSNCGEELPKGSLICLRCGTRQAANANSGGNGGNNGGGNNRKNSSDGNGNKKIIGLVAAVVLVVVGVVFGVIKFSKPSDEFFTHDITFDSNKLSVINENTLRYIQVPANKTFNIGTRDSIVDVNIKDEVGNLVEFVIDKTSKNDRFVIKPNDKWNNTHIYSLTLGNNSYFTDEDMYKFKKVVFSIEREKEYSYKLKSNIKNLINNPNEVVEIGDIVTIQDSNGQYVCKRVNSKSNGAINYEDVALTDVFEDLIIVDNNIKPDFKQLLKSGDLEKNILMDFINSDIFDVFVMTTYANSLDELNMDSEETYFQNMLEDSEKTNIINQLIGNTKEVFKFSSQKFGDFYISLNIDEESLRKNAGLKFTISISKYILGEDKKYNEYKEKKKDPISYGIKKNVEKAEEQAGISDLTDNDSDGSLSLDITININPTIASNIDLERYIFSVNDYTTVAIDLDFHGNFAYEQKFKQTLKGNKRKVFNKNSNDEYSESDECLLLNVPVPTPIPFVNFFFRSSYLPKFTGEIDLKIGTHLVLETNQGITFSLLNGFEQHKLVKKSNDRSNLHVAIDGKVEMDFQFKATTGLEVFLGVDVPGIGSVGVKLANANLYAKFVPFVLAEGKAEFIIEDLLNVQDNSKYQELQIKLTVGAKYDVGFEGELRITRDFPGLSGEVSFLKGKIILYEYNSSYNATESEIKNILPVGNEGSDIMLGLESFKIIQKDDANGLALLIANKGDIVKAYDNKQLGQNNDSLSGTWANSTLNKYLNNEYLNRFDPFYRTCIEPVIVKVAGSGVNAECKVFILSKDELNNNRFLDTESERQLETGFTMTNAKIGQYTDKDKHIEQGKAVYWVRDNVGKLNAMVVNSSGWINEEGAVQSDETIFVRPAFWVRYKDREVSADLKDISKGVYGSIYVDSIEMENTLDSIKAYIGDRDAYGDYNSTFENIIR